MSYVREYYSDGHFEDRHSSFGSDVMRDLSENVDPAAKIGTAAIKMFASGTSKLANRMLTPEELAEAEANAQKPDKRSGLMINILSQSGGAVGEYFSTAKELDGQMRSQTKAIAKSLFHKIGK